jgi:hypothetical protein
MKNNMNKNELIGKKVLLYPSDTYKKIALIENIDNLGFTFKILESQDSKVKVDSRFFYNHAKPIIFQIL